MKIVILANEIGDKLWPLTSAKQPKALLSLYSDKSMLEETLRRAFPLCTDGGQDLYIVSTKEACQKIKELKLHTQFKIPAINIIPTTEKEDSQEDNLLLMSRMLTLLDRKTEDTELIAFVPSDQYFWPEEGFIFHMQNMIVAAEQESNQLYTLSMPPGTAAAIMNYIKVDWDTTETVGATYPINAGKDILSTPLVIPLDYKPTPDISTAETLMQEAWLWDLKTYVATLGFFKEHVTALPSQTLVNILSNLMEAKKLKIAIATKVVWSIIDNWSSIKYLTYEAGLFMPPEDKNIHSIESSGNLIKKKPEKEVILVGVDDLVVIDTDDKLLIGTPQALYEHF